MVVDQHSLIRDRMDWNPSSPRRARGPAVYANLRSLGRGGVVVVRDRTCSPARWFTDRLSASDRAEMMKNGLAAV
jgi:glutamate/tyrosine decarboxylase-like PLP-dependent enzyme